MSNYRTVAIEKGGAVTTVVSHEKGPSLEITSKCLPLRGAAEHDQFGVFM